MDDDRFEQLMGRLLDEELSAEEMAELGRLASERPDREAELQSQLESAGLIAQAEDELRDSPLFVAATLDRITGDPFVAGVRSAITGRASRPWIVPQRLSPVALGGRDGCRGPDRERGRIPLEGRIQGRPDHRLERVGAMDRRRRAGESRPRGRAAR